MNAALLLNHYGRIADAPDAIARLRRFVLDLAVRGKLVEQDEGDEPASELLKNARGKALKGRKATMQSVMAETPCSLPPSWEWVPVGTAFEYDAGRKVEPKSLNPDAWLLELEDVEKDTGRLASRVRVSDRSSQSTKSEFAKGDVLYGKLRPYLNKVIVAEETGYSTTEIVALRPVVAAYPPYCALALRRPDFVEYVSRLGQGTKMPRLRTEDALIAPFPLPPIAEQHRIVAKVDELMALCDQLEAARAEREAARDTFTPSTLDKLNTPDPETFGEDARFALANLAPLTTRADQIKQLRQTILNLAVRGKLVTQDAADEPATSLLDKFAKAKLERKRQTGDARIKPATTPRPEMLPIDLPAGWAIQSLENLFLFIDYRGNTPPKTEDGIPLITAKNIRMGYLNKEPREFISQATFKTWMTRGFPQVGDLFFTTEAPLANVCLNDINEPFALAQRSICLQPYAAINTKFLMFALMSEPMQALIDAHATGMTAKGIKAANLKPLPIPIPPLAEQHRIVAKVDEMMALCDQLEASLTTGEQTRSRLLDAVLHDALEPA